MLDVQRAAMLGPVSAPSQRVGRFAGVGSILVVGSMGLVSLLSACSPREPSPAEPARTQPSTTVAPATPDDAEPQRVQLSLALVDASTREPFIARHGSDSAIARADVLLAVHHRIAAPWHIYWKNPGESGLSTKLELGGSGFTAGPVQYPAPERIVAAGGQVSYGWERDAILFVPIELEELGDGARIELRSDWLACHESCIPGHATVTATLAELSAGADASKPDALLQTMLARARTRR